MKTKTLPESAGRPSRARSPRSPRSPVRLELFIRSCAMTRPEARVRRKTLAAWMVLVMPSASAGRSDGARVSVRTIAAGGSDATGAHRWEVQS